MNMLNEPLNIFFSKVQPEEIYRELLAQGRANTNRYFCAQHILGERGSDRFYRNAEELQKRYSIDEISYIHGLTKERAQRKAEGDASQGDAATVFYLLPEFTKDVLSFQFGEPLCNRQKVFQWRAMALRLGQDILTTAHLAYDDKNTGGRTDFFAWPTVIHVNNPIVEAVMEKEVAENHFHLLGSVPPFHMSWVEIMNHPGDIYRLETVKWVKDSFDRELSPSFYYRPNERNMSAVELLQLAFWLRVQLFNRVRGFGPISYIEIDEQQDRTIHTERIPYSCLEDFEQYQADRKVRFDHIAERMRMSYGKCFFQSNGQEKCLDYAFPDHLHNEKNDNYYRVLAGERYILYRCFFECFSGGFDEYEQDLFYLYLLLKSWFRNELIQVNQRLGFRNFSDYQDRKDAMWEHRQEYVAEGYRIAINGNLEDQMLRTQENRITPAKSKRQLREKIYKIDREVIFTANSYYNDKGDSYPFNEKKWYPPELYQEAQQMKTFYTIHFPKSPDKMVRGATNWIPPRNIKQRKDSKQQALALAQALTEYPYLRYRIRGIDGCSHEIGCRPETFATEFRFLRHFRSSSIVQEDIRSAATPLPKLYATYHAGEDFLDITDGLRAIDEAIKFLELEQGDRLGHALALGLEPEDYYRLKDYTVVTTKQNRLDDLVWVLCRGNEFNIWIPTGLYHQLEKEAYILLNEIYGRNIVEWSNWNMTLHDYFESWKLRGDHPDCFTEKEREKSKWYTEQSALGGYYSYKSQYMLFEERKQEYMSSKPCVREIMYYYHYDRKIREKSREKVSVKCSDEWVKLIRQIQDVMMKRIGKRGIYIECNPTSNYLISTFESYREHPIFRFNERWKGILNGNQLCVSINTDDMGVFDTSLENEYALIAAAMEEMADENGERQYSDEAIRAYLENIRIMSNQQTFHSIQGGKSVQRRYRTNPQLTNL